MHSQHLIKTSSSKGAGGRPGWPRDTSSARHGPHAPGPAGHPLPRQRPCGPASCRLGLRRHAAAATAWPRGAGPAAGAAQSGGAPNVARPPLARGHHALALARRAGRHPWASRLGPGGLGCPQGCRAPREPLPPRRGELGQGRGTRERPGGDPARGARGGLPRGQRGGEERPASVRITPRALEGLQQPGPPGLGFPPQGQPPWVAVWALSPTRAAGEGQALLPRLLSAVRAASDLEARTLKMGAGWGPTPSAGPLGRQGGGRVGARPRRPASRARARAGPRSAGAPAGLGQGGERAAEAGHKEG